MGAIWGLVVDVDGCVSHLGAVGRGGGNIGVAIGSALTNKAVDRYLSTSSYHKLELK